MPHVVVLYTGNLEHETDISMLCRSLADALVAQRDESGNPVFPRAGVRVFALPSTHYAVADGSGDFGFVYLNLRMAKGRSDPVRKAAGDALSDAARVHFAPLLATHHVGITLQVDESPGQIYDGKLGNLHDLFRPA